MLNSYFQRLSFDILLALTAIAIALGFIGQHIPQLLKQAQMTESLTGGSLVRYEWILQHAHTGVRPIAASPNPLTQPELFSPVADSITFTADGFWLSPRQENTVTTEAVKFQAGTPAPLGPLRWKIRHQFNQQ